MRHYLIAALAAGVAACSAESPAMAPGKAGPPIRTVQAATAPEVVVPPGSPALGPADLAEIRKILPARLAPDQVKSRSIQQVIRPFDRHDLERFPIVYPDWFYYRFLYRGYPYWWPYSYGGGFWYPHWGRFWW